MPIASSAPATIVITRNQGTNVPLRSKPSLPKNVGTALVVPGSQIVAVRPTRNNIRPSVTTSWETSGAVDSRRMNNRSIDAPITGAATSTVKASATSVCMPAVTLSSQ